MEHIDVSGLVGDSVMNVLHVITGGEGRGGAEGALLKLISSSPKDIEHHVFILQPMPEYMQEFKSIGVDLFCIDIKKPFLFMVNFIGLIKKIRNINPDVIQCWMYHSNFIFGLIGRSMGIPVFWNIRQSACDVKNLGYITYCIMKVCALLSYFIPFKTINCSQLSIENHRGSGYSNNVVYIPNGVDVDPEYPVTSSKSYFDINEETFVFGHLARFSPVKNHKLYLDAFDCIDKDNTNITATIMAGSGVCLDNSEFKKLSNSFLTDRIILQGQLDTLSQLKNTFLAMDCLVLSSFSEGFPNVLIEAMSFGIPCITTNVGDAADIVGGSGWVVPVDDKQAMIGAMMQALRDKKNKSEWEKRKLLAREIVLNKYSMECMVRSYASTWREAI
jgi:glycosyltransferase involved in cell wall biosynthesis